MFPMRYRAAVSALLLSASLLSACGGGGDDLPPAAPGTLYSVANGCFSIGVVYTSRFIVASASGDEYEVSAPSLDLAARFVMKPSDLGTYLLFDESEQYFTSDGSSLDQVEARARRDAVVQIAGRRSQHFDVG